MRELYQLSKAPRKIWKPLPGGDHNSSVLEEGYFETITEFVNNLCIDDYYGQEKKESS